MLRDRCVDGREGGGDEGVGVGLAEPKVVARRARVVEPGVDEPIVEIELRGGGVGGVDADELDVG